jgi:acetate kinase
MRKLIFPKNYRPQLDLIQTEKAIKSIKDFFELSLASELTLRRVTAPLFVLRGTGVNDDLNGVEKILNKESGLLGISGISSDLRDVEREYAKGNDRARLAMETYAYHIRKYIGAYAVALGRVDAIIFTAGVGEHASLIREWACRGLDAIGATLDTFKNATRHDESIISKSSSRVRIMIVPTNEELMIARDTAQLVRR